MTKSENESKEAAPLTALVWFFIIITVGGIFLSIGLVGLYRWFYQLPTKIPFEFAMASLIVGVVMDGWMILRFWRQREKLYQAL